MNVELHRTKVSGALRQEILEKSFEACQRIEFGEPTLLLIDCDSDRAFDHVVETLGWASELLGVLEAWYTYSKTPGHTHVFARLGVELSQRERALLQGALGGDSKRAVLDWRWAEQGGEGECFLIEANRLRHPIDLTNEHKGAY